MGASAFYRGNDFPGSVAQDPCDSALRASGRDREGLAAGAGTGCEDGVGVGSCVGVYTDDVSVFSATMVITVILHSRVLMTVVGGIGLE
ncbi:hypothetical protein AOC05_00875 [Arthrobacter alpinus]|uniref:Uncharacterized protein n=1 Tax=Arthrobacter alpinus TaxID=656366 RepID=A0A0M3UFM1_9MICC|nr:hypothetical protein AOC05_00875 [Arthrobacter alpinus]